MLLEASSSERRKFLRVDCLVNSKIVAIRNGEEVGVVSGITKNVSAAGLLFKSLERFSMGGLVAVSVELGMLADFDDNAARVIKTKGYVLGKVVRIEEFDGGEFREYGISFVELDTSGNDYLKLFQDLVNVALYSEELKEKT
jgi:hypothetical protein